MTGLYGAEARSTPAQYKAVSRFCSGQVDPRSGATEGVHIVANFTSTARPAHDGASRARPAQPRVELRCLLPSQPITVEESGVSGGAEAQEFNRQAIREFGGNMHAMCRTIRASYQWLFRMRLLLFGIGVATAIAAVVRGFLTSDTAGAIQTVTFAGLSAASFFTLFIVKPLEEVEQDAMFSSWLLSIISTFWLRYAYATNDIDKFQEITRDCTSALTALVDKHAKVTKSVAQNEAGSVATGNKSGGAVRFAPDPSRQGLA